MAEPLSEAHAEEVCELAQHEVQRALRLLANEIRDGRAVDAFVLANVYERYSAGEVGL